jgi:hypothetical protein
MYFKFTEPPYCFPKKFIIFESETNAYEYLYLLIDLQHLYADSQGSQPAQRHQDAGCQTRTD